MFLYNSLGTLVIFLNCYSNRPKPKANAKKCPPLLRHIWFALLCNWLVPKRPAAINRFLCFIIYTYISLRYICFKIFTWFQAVFAAFCCNWEASVHQCNPYVFRRCEHFVNFVMVTMQSLQDGCRSVLRYRQSSVHPKEIVSYREFVVKMCVVLSNSGDRLIYSWVPVPDIVSDGL